MADKTDKTVVIETDQVRWYLNADEDPAGADKQSAETDVAEEVKDTSAGRGRQNPDDKTMDKSNPTKVPQSETDDGQDETDRPRNHLAGRRNSVPGEKSDDVKSDDVAKDSEDKKEVSGERDKPTHKKAGKKQTEEREQKARSRLLKLRCYQTATLIITYLAYVSYHLSRKPLSVVKNSLHKNCSSVHTNDAFSNHTPNDTTWCDWKPFDGSDYEHLYGWLDVGFLGTYAVCMFISGYVAERVNLRYFLTGGMLMAGLSVAMFGVGYFLNIHSFAYYLVMQMVAGVFESTGWPAVVATVGNWFGPGRRGAIMGLWNSHTSVGNILGGLIPGIWADGPWGWSFIVPGIIIASVGILIFFFLVPYPEDVGIEVQNTRSAAGTQSGAVVESHSVSTNITSGEDTPLLKADADHEHAAVSLTKALFLPGVIEFSLCLFFAKLVSYTFLFWLPKYIGSTTHFSAEKSADLSTLFDVGGTVGGFFAGVMTDYNRSPGCNCVILLFLGTPMLFVYQAYGSVSYGTSIGMLLVLGAFVNGPYALITTAVSAELGTQRALRGNKKALATVTSIIDGTGSIGAALGPLLTSWISPTGWQNVFYMLIGANILAAVFLVRIVYKEVRTRLGYVDPDSAPITDFTTEVYVDPKHNNQADYEHVQGLEQS